MSARKNPLFSVALPRITLQQVLEDGSWKNADGSIEITVIEGGKKPRLLNRRDTIRAEQRKVDSTPTSVESNLIRQWNREHGELGRRKIVVRGETVTNGERISVTAMFRGFVPPVQGTLDKRLKQYISALYAGKHRADGRDYSYKSLINWMKAVDRAYISKQPCWWEEDEEAEATAQELQIAERVHSTFVETFLPTAPTSQVNNLRTRSATQFLRTARKLFDLKEQLSVDDGLKLLMIALKRNSTGVVTPAQLCSPHTWDVLMPQYISQIAR